MPLSPVIRIVLLRGADDLDHLEELLHLLALADEVAHPVDFPKLAPQIDVLFTQPAAFERALNDQLQFLDEVFGFQNVIEGAHLQRLDRGFCGGESGQKDELSGKAAVAQVAQQIDARHVGHLDVRHDQIEFRRPCCVPGLLLRCWRWYTSNPSFLRKISSSSRMDRSSSTIRILARFGHSTDL